MDRKDILNNINEIITQEHGEILKEDNLLADCGIDSFGYAILFMELNEKYNCFGKDWKLGTSFEDGENIDYSVYKVKDLIDRIIGKQKSNKCIRKVRKYKNNAKKYKSKIKKCS